MITVLGFYGHSNCGDESYRLTFPQVFPEHEFSFTDNLKKSSDSNSYILGGGNIASDFFIDQLASLPKETKKHAFSISVTKGDNVKKLAEVTDNIFVRDFESVRLFQKSGIAVGYLPDFAFMLTSNKEAGDALVGKYLENCDKYTKKVAVVINSYLIHSSLTRDHFSFEKMSFELANAIDTTSASFIFIPFGSEPPADDRISNSWVSSKCKYYKKNVVIYDKLTVQQTLDIFGSVDAVISSRLHSSIFSCIAGKPFIDLTHHDKNLVFLQSIYKEDWSVPYWDFNKKKFINLLNDFLFNPSSPSSIADNHRLMLSGVHKHVHLC
jgi:polysaccharide pyruvyl transferase WcaK-like protein